MVSCYTVLLHSRTRPLLAGWLAAPPLLLACLRSTASPPSSLHRPISHPPTTNTTLGGSKFPWLNDNNGGDPRALDNTYDVKDQAFIARKISMQHGSNLTQATTAFMVLLKSYPQGSNVINPTRSGILLKLADPHAREVYITQNATQI